MMAYVKHEAIHAKGHLYSAFIYDSRAEKVTIFQENNHLNNLLSYVSSANKTELQLMTFINCNKDTIDEDFDMAKIIHNKPDKIVAHQYFQSFKPGEGTPELIHKIGVELAQKIAPSYQVAVYTHVDKAHLHNHIIINSVNIVTGYKFVANKESLRHIRQVSDDLCRKYGLSVIKPDKTLKPLDRNTYKAALEGRSWKVDLAVTLDKALKVCQNKREFISYLEKSGYEVFYYNNNITVRKEGELKKIRLDTLAKQFGEQYKKVNIEKKIRENSTVVIPERINDSFLNEEARKAEVAEYKKQNIEILRLVDEAVEISRSKQEFIDYFKDRDYEIKYQNSNISIKGPTMKKARRLDTLARYYGKQYTKDSIEKRISANGTWKYELKKAIDIVLTEAKSRDDFKNRMEFLGYTVEFRDKDAMIMLAGSNNYVTLSSLSKIYNRSYSLSALDNKFMYKNPPQHQYKYNEVTKTSYKTEWQRYERWYFKNKENEENRNIADPDIRLIDSLKRSILYSHNMSLMMVRVAILAALYMNKDRRLRYKKYKEWKKFKIKNSGVTRPADSKVIGNISYKRLIEADGDNVVIKIKPQQVALLFNKPLFYSAKIFRDGRAYVTVKAHDEALLYKILNIDTRKLQQDYDIQAQRENYQKLKEIAQKKGMKLHYMKVDEQRLNILKTESFPMAYFVNDDGSYNVSYLDDEKLLELEMKNKQMQKGKDR